MTDKRLLEKKEYRVAIEMYDFVMREVQRSRSTVLKDRGEYRKVIEEVYFDIHAYLIENREALMQILLKAERGSR